MVNVRYPLSIALVLFGLLFFRTFDFRADETEESNRKTNDITRDDIVKAIELHLTVDDFLFDGAARNEAMIVNNPKVAGPLLMERLLSTENAHELSNSTNLLIKMKYDRGKIRSAVKKVMSRARTDLKGEIQKHILIDTSRSLGRIGTAEDAEELLPLLKHRERRVQMNAVRALGEIADADVVPKIEQSLEQHAEGMSADELRQDLHSEQKQYSFLYQGFQAIAKIKYRTLLQKQLK